MRKKTEKTYMNFNPFQSLNYFYTYLYAITYRAPHEIVPRGRPPSIEYKSSDIKVKILICIAL